MMNRLNLTKYINEACQRWSNITLDHSNFIYVHPYNHDGVGDSDSDDVELELESLKINFEIPKLIKCGFPTIECSIDISKAAHSSKYTLDSRCVTNIRHPNIGDGGYICIGIEDKEWDMSLVFLIRSIEELLVSPNFDDPLLCEFPCKDIETYLSQFTN